MQLEILPYMSILSHHFISLNLALHGNFIYLFISLAVTRFHGFL